MNCEWSDQLDRLVDGELPEPEATQLESHLRSCASCAAEAYQSTRLKRSVRSAAAAAFAPRTEFSAQLQAQLRAQAAAPPLPSTLPVSPVRQRWAWPALALACALAIVVVALSLALVRLPNRQRIAEVADLHVATLASSNPVDVVSTDRHTVKPWFAGRLPFTFNLPELGQTTFRLIGGRVTYLGQTPGAQLLFGVRQHQISAFIFPERDFVGPLTSGLSEQQTLQFTVESWASGGLRYYVIGDASPEDLRALTALLRQASHL